MRCPVVQVCFQQLSLLFKGDLLFKLCSNSWGLKRIQGEQQALVSIATNFGTHCHIVEAHANQAFLEPTNAITFIDEDMEVQHLDHSRSLYVAAQINDVHIRMALVDIGTSLNLVPTSRLKATRIPLCRIAGASIEVSGLDGIHEYCIESMQLVLKSGTHCCFHQISCDRLTCVISCSTWNAMAPQT